MTALPDNRKLDIVFLILGRCHAYPLGQDMLLACIIQP